MAKDAGGLAGALDYIGALNVATKITTVIGLAALAVIVAFLLSSQWLSGRRAQISQAIDKGDDQALAALLGTMNVSLDGMSAAEKFDTAREESRRRFWQKMVWQSFLFAGFLALLLFVWALVQPKPRTPEREPIGAMTMMQMLLFVPEDQRQALCARTLAAGQCGNIVQSIAGLSRQGTPKVEQQVATSLAEGTVAKGLAIRLDRIGTVRGVQRLTAGDPRGWDVVFRACGGAMGARNLKNATAAARALAQVPGERIASGVTLGAIDVGHAAAQPMGGTWIASDASAGKAEAVAAIRRTLAARGFDRYPVRESAATGKWRIELFDCGFALGEARKL